MVFFQSISLLLVGLIVYRLHKFGRHIHAAKKTGLRYVVVPLLETEIVAQLATPILRKLYTDQLDAGKGWPSWCRFMIKDWSWEDKRFAHDQYGDVFLVVSPAGIICYVADADVSWDVLNRRYDFTKPRDKYSKSDAASRLTTTKPLHILDASVPVAPTDHDSQKSLNPMDQMLRRPKAARTGSTSASPPLPSPTAAVRTNWYGEKPRGRPISSQTNGTFSRQKIPCSRTSTL